MLIISVCLYLLVNIDLSLSINYKDEDGRDVDWFIVYKIPKNPLQVDPINTGFGYAYLTGMPLDSSDREEVSKWKLSKKKTGDEDSILGNTLGPLYADHKEPKQTFTHILYSDKLRKKNVCNSYLAHAKGVLAADQESGFWLIHSIPNFPSTLNESYKYPSSGAENGQTALCLSVGPNDVPKVAAQLLYMCPNVYSRHLDVVVVKYAPDLVTLIERKWPKDSDSSQQTIISLKGTEFIGFSRSSKAKGDLWSQYVAPGLKSNLTVQTWRRGQGNPLPSECKSEFTVQNVNNITLQLADSILESTSIWSYLEDHSKWGVSSSIGNPFACIGDINRMKSQFKRGGGTLCINSTVAWQNFRNSINETEGCLLRNKGHHRRTDVTLLAMVLAKMILYIL